MPAKSAVAKPIEVRPATAEDLRGVQGVAERTWRAAYAGLIPDADIEAFLAGAYNQEYLRLTLDHLGGGLIVAVEDGEVIGYAMAGRNRAGVAELFAIYVLPERQGCGVGWRLWRRALDRARDLGAEAVGLWVLEANVGARRFYERQGAEPTAERDFPVGAGAVREVGYRVPVRPDSR
jgi:ribosomal protein S18 acetylase RimI-like enzyme